MSKANASAARSARINEIFSLEWDDVDFKRREITLKETKNNLSRSIPMNDLVEKTLDKHPRRIVDGEACPLVLAHPDGKPYHTLLKPFRKALTEAGLPRIRIHDLRHSFASNLVIAGMPLNVVQELLGHRDITTTMIYAHLAPNAKRTAVDSLMQRDQDERTGLERNLASRVNWVTKY